MLYLTGALCLRFGATNSHGLYYPVDMTLTGLDAPLPVSWEHWQRDDYIFSWPGLAQRHPAGLVGWHVLDDERADERAMLDAVLAGRLCWSTGPDATPAAAAARRAQPPAEPLPFTWPARRRHVGELAYTFTPADGGLPAVRVVAQLPAMARPAPETAIVLYALWALNQLLRIGD